MFWYVHQCSRLTSRRTTSFILLVAFVLLVFAMSSLLKVPAFLVTSVKLPFDGDLPVTRLIASSLLTFILDPFASAHVRSRLYKNPT